MAEKKKYLMLISYIGSGFCGSQFQIRRDIGEPLHTVQYVIERLLKNIFKLEGERPLIVSLSSRTDKGVHALRTGMTAFLPKYNSGFIQPNRLVTLLNKNLSESENIRVLEAHIVPESFRFCEFIKDKTYMYRIGFLKKEFSENPYRNILPIAELNRTYFLSEVISHSYFDLKRAQEATPLFEGIKDFAAVMKKTKPKIKQPMIITPTICNVMSFRIEESQPLFPFDSLCQRYKFYHFYCKGNRFLYQMVRRMISVTLSVGFNVLSLKDIQKLFDEPSPSSWPVRGINLVPGYGLYLVDININLENIQKKEISQETNREVHLTESVQGST